MSYHPATFSGYRHALSGVIIILVCQAISKDHVIKRSYNFVGKSQQYTSWGYQNILEHISVWGHWKILSSKNQTRKIVLIHKKIELYQVFMYNFLCQTVLIFSICIYIICKNNWNILVKRCHRYMSSSTIGTKCL